MSTATMPDEIRPPVDLPTTRRLGIPLRRRTLAAAPPAGVFLVIHGVTVALTWWLAKINQWGFGLDAWDGNWYLAIAEHGYLGVNSTFTDAAGHHTPQTAMVFFPGYPLLVRLAAPLAGGHYLAAAVAVSTIAGIVATYGIARLTRRVTGSERAAWIAVVLFAAAPMSIVEVMAYPEAVLTALAVWTVIATLERHWLLAGICALAAGYVSPMGAPVVVIAMAAALVDLIRSTPDWRTGWPHLACLTVAPIGMLGYLNWVNSHGISFFAAQRAGWGTRFDGGWDTIRWIAVTLFTGDTGVYTTVVAVGAIVAVVLCVPVARRTPWQVWAYTLLAVVLALGSTGIQWDKLRLFLSAFPLLLPIASSWARRSTRHAVLLTVLGAAIGVWVSIHSLTVWHYSI